MSNLTIGKANLEKSPISTKWRFAIGNSEEEDPRLSPTIRVSILRNTERNSSTKVDKCVILGYIVQFKHILE